MSYNFKEEASRILALDESGEKVGEVEFSWEGEEVIIIDHTKVDPSQQGKGLGSQLIEQVVDKAKNENLQVMPICSYAKKKFMENEDYQSVLQK
jgi:hypothetical protein